MLIPCTMNYDFLKSFLAIAMGMFILCFVSISTYAGTGIFPTHSDINYVGDGNVRHLLDVYIPPNVNSPRPAVVYIHGGGWKNGDKGTELRHPLRKVYEDLEYVIVTVNYRYSTTDNFPAQIHDVKTAVRYLRKNADTFFIDPCAIGTMGHSAGGHLAALMGTSNNEPSLEGDHLGSTGYSSEIQAVATFFPAIDLLNDTFHQDCIDRDDREPYDFSQINGYPEEMIDCIPVDCPELADEVNPITYVNGNEPSFLIYHGTADCVVPFDHSVQLDAALLQNGGDSDFHVGDNKVHADPYFYTNTTVLDSIKIFFSNHLGGVGPCDSGDCITLAEHADLISDQDLFVDGETFEANPTTTFTDPAPAGALLSNVELLVYFRTLNASCEEEITLRVTDPAGNATTFNHIFTTTDCTINTLHSTTLYIPNASTNGDGSDWVVEYRDSDDQNSGDEYSMRFARLNYDYVVVADLNADCDGDGVSNGNDLAPNDACVSGPSTSSDVYDVFDNDFYVDDVGFDNNPSIDFTLPFNQVTAALTNVELVLYFRVERNSCQNDIDVRITDPTGNVITALALLGGPCSNTYPLYAPTVSLPNVNISGNNFPTFKVEFNDSNGQLSGVEFSLRAAVLKYDYDLFPTTNPSCGPAKTQTIFTKQPIKENNSLFDLAEKPMNLSIYPNPTQAQAHFELDNNQTIQKVEVFDRQGRVVATYSGVQQIDVSQLNTGIYLVRAYTNKGVATGKICKQ